MLLWLALLVCTGEASGNYTPDWPSLDSRPTPVWWLDAKFGISLHWGVYSVPAFSTPGGGNPFSEWYWNYLGENATQCHPPKNPIQEYHCKTFGDHFRYESFATRFKGELYNPDAWASLFQRAGAKWALLTSKHHDGFELWPSPNAWNWNSVDVGPGRDLVGDFMGALKTHGITPGLYHSVYEWFNSLYRGEDPTRYVTEKLIPDLKAIVKRYQPHDLLVDGEWEHNSTFWQTRPFLAWLFNESPVKDIIAVDDRWGNECRGHCGGYYICENGGSSDFCNGNGAGDNGIKHPWVYWATMGYSWGFSQVEGSIDYKTSEHFIRLLITSVVDGGGLLLNVGPTAAGIIPAIQESVLLDIGAWLDVNGDAIYSTRFRKGVRREVVLAGTEFSAPRTNENNVYGVPVGHGTKTIHYMGKTASAAACESACAKVASCMSYTWHDTTTGSYASMCYGRNDTVWSLKSDAGHISGRRRFTDVQYTTRGTTLYAIVGPTFPFNNRDLKLTHPVVSSTTKVTLLGVAGTVAYTALPHAGVVLHVPQIDPADLPCSVAWAFALTDTQ